MPSQTKENYLKAIYFLSANKNKITITALANKMQVSKPTSNNMVKKLQEDGLVTYKKYQPITITKKGEKIATSIIRKHRLTEMFLTQVMSFGWEEVHDIAEEMEHLNSDKFFDRMDALLGFPTVDPHGSPIPDKLGNIQKANYQNFTNVAKGKKVALKAMTESSKELLLYLNKKNIKLGSFLTIKEIEEFDQTYEVIIDNHTSSTTLSYQVCKCLLVAP
jgi:DtxR family Mn-dependent transcriptional regulator